jgi:hypothetical protein
MLSLEAGSLYRQQHPGSLLQAIVEGPNHGNKVTLSRTSTLGSQVHPQTQEGTRIIRNPMRSAPSDQLPPLS